MSMRTLFWIIMLLWLISGIWFFWPVGGSYIPLGLDLVAFTLFSLVGWKIFGPPIQG